MARTHWPSANPVLSIASGQADQALYIGLMSGTSMDGIDAVLAAFPATRPARILASVSTQLPDALRTEFLQLNSPGPNELARAAQAGNELAALYAKACLALLDQAGLSASRIRAVGAHGQTVRHEPGAGYTIQLNSPALLAELTGIDVVADFRSRDVAAGGQGAPLVPAFHRAVFQAAHSRVVLNLGGIANVSILEPGCDVVGFDTGPANVLMDMWCQDHTGQPFDEGGAWAAQGNVNQHLLEQLASEPWFALPPPKSTGRDLFNRHWLEQHLKAVADKALHPADVQATLQALTADTVARAIRRWAPNTTEVLVCGGGANNTGLMQLLQARLGYPVRPTSELGIPVQQVEALAFAWLARAFLDGEHTGLPSVTGARGARLLGAWYPAGIRR